LISLSSITANAVSMQRSTWHRRIQHPTETVGDHKKVSNKIMIKNHQTSKINRETSNDENDDRVTTKITGPHMAQ
jgi:hypothetical protein